MVRQHLATRFTSGVVLVGLVAVMATSCGSSAPVGATSPDSSPTSSDNSSAGPSFLSGDTNATPEQIATQLNATDISTDPQIEDHANSEVSCLFDDQSMTILSFDSSAQQSAWFAAGSQVAGTSGVVVMGSNWAIETFDSGQATAVQHIIGGTISQMQP